MAEGEPKAYSPKKPQVTDLSKGPNKLPVTDLSKKDPKNPKVHVVETLHATSLLPNIPQKKVPDNQPPVPNDQAQANKDIGCTTALMP